MQHSVHSVHVSMTQSPAVGTSQGHVRAMHEITPAAATGTKHVYGPDKSKHSSEPGSPGVLQAWQRTGRRRTKKCREDLLHENEQGPGRAAGLGHVCADGLQDAEHGTELLRVSDPPVQHAGA